MSPFKCIHAQHCMDTLPVCAIKRFYLRKTATSMYFCPSSCMWICIYTCVRFWSQCFPDHLQGWLCYPMAIRSPKRISMPGVKEWIDLYVWLPVLTRNRSRAQGQFSLWNLVKGELLQEMREMYTTNSSNFDLYFHRRLPSATLL